MRSQSHGRGDVQLATSRREEVCEPTQSQEVYGPMGKASSVTTRASLPGVFVPFLLGGLDLGGGIELLKGSVAGWLVLLQTEEMSGEPSSEALLEAVGRAVAPLANVRAALLFGSRATGRARPHSDIDVAILLDEAPGADRKDVLMSLIAALGAELRSDRLDVVLLNDAPPKLAFHVLKDGLVAFERAPEHLHRFRVATYSRHSDYEPVERFFRAKAKERAQRGVPGG